VIDVLIFDVERHRYAVRADDVHAVLRATAIVSLPDAPPVVQGVIDYHGRILPVFDLRTRFGAARRPLQADEQFIVVLAAERMVALRTDRAVGLVRLDDASIHSLNAVSAAGQYVEGLATLPDGLVLIADVHAFLSASETMMLDDALGARADHAVGAAAQ